MPLIPISKITILPIDVPIAKNLLPVVDIQVGIPTPLVSELVISKSYDTFLSAMYIILRIC